MAWFLYSFYPLRSAKEMKMRSLGYSLILFLALFLLAFGGSHDLEKADVEFFLKIKGLILTPNQAEVADLISYPIHVKIEGNIFSFEDKRSLLEKFDSVFSSEVQEAIQLQDAKRLFKSWRGVMVGSGQLWFDQIQESDGSNFVYRIIGINPQSIKD